MNEKIDREKEKKDREKDEAERRLRVAAVEGAFIPYFTAARTAIADTSGKVKKLRADADYLEKWVQIELESLVDAWNKAMDKSRFPVEGGTVVPYTRRISPNELELFIGQDELINITVGADNIVRTCWFGPLNDETRKRTCYLCNRQAMVAAEHVDVSVIPDKLPAHIAAIVDGTELAVEDE